MCLFQTNLNKMKCIIYENTPTGISVKVLLLSMDCCETGFFSVPVSCAPGYVGNPQAREKCRPNDGNVSMLPIK